MYRQFGTISHYQTTRRVWCTDSSVQYLTIKQPAESDVPTVRYNISLSNNPQSLMYRQFGTISHYQTTRRVWCTDSSVQYLTIKQPAESDVPTVRYNISLSNNPQSLITDSSVQYLTALSNNPQSLMYRQFGTISHYQTTRRVWCTDSSVQYLTIKRPAESDVPTVRYNISLSNNPQSLMYRQFGTISHDQTTRRVWCADSSVQYLTIKQPAESDVPTVRYNISLSNDPQSLMYRQFGTISHYQTTRRVWCTDSSVQYLTIKQPAESDVPTVRYNISLSNNPQSLRYRQFGTISHYQTTRRVWCANSSVQYLNIKQPAEPQSLMYQQFGTIISHYQTTRRVWCTDGSVQYLTIRQPAESDVPTVRYNISLSNNPQNLIYRQFGTISHYQTTRRVWCTDSSVQYLTI